MTTTRRKSSRGRTYGGESPEVRARRRYQAFLDAGLELFGTVGYRATTMRKLCKTAGLTDRYFYASFHSMEDLLVVVYEKQVAEIQQHILTAVLAVQPKGDNQALINTGLDAFFAAVEDARVARVVWQEIMGVSPRVDALYNQTVQNFASLLKSLMQGIHPDWISNQDAGLVHRVALGVVGSVSQVTLDWLLSDYQAPRADVVASVAMILRGLLLVAEADS
ncbi:TetR/AcrR family transcriptional regulator [Alcanivorax sediminis]|uniref:TetR family transcriptional regulator n=1 Tax=Alcanivorax sediminis TaxID=2663008 RepID=A0A6N7LVD5_9GAMM|nr:TetR/AcrR family transcriptional regulator [Alcanivorax sediminis]MQX52271.1 TetR family transcriptional regulator [Alcanivorax sediminis]